jgi:hypothetical protein
VRCCRVKKNGLFRMSEKTERELRLCAALFGSVSGTHVRLEHESKRPAGIDEISLYGSKMMLSRQDFVHHIPRYNTVSYADENFGHPHLGTISQSQSKEVDSFHAGCGAYLAPSSLKTLGSSDFMWRSESLSRPSSASQRPAMCGMALR